MRSAEERDRRADKHTVTAREAAINRTKTPDRRSAPTDKARAATDGRRSAETRPRDQKQEAPVEGMTIPPPLCAQAGQTLETDFG